MIQNINTLSKSEILRMYDFKETEDWTLEGKKALFKIGDNSSIIPVSYRPFDLRYTYYPINKINEIIPRGDSRRVLMRNIIEGSLAFICFRQSRDGVIGNFWITKEVVSKDIISSLDSATIFPLYIYPEPTNNLFANTERTPNLNAGIIQQIADGLGINFEPEKTSKPNNENRTSKIEPKRRTHQKSFAPIDVLDYIYAVLHSPNYREKYKEFLKIDFPRVPYPRDLTTFEKLSNLGSQLRQIHLLESNVVEEYITQYPEDGNDMVVKIKYENERVYINENQYFDNVPEIAWNFYIGGYQPAQKWLKDRKERVLSFEDILHYQKIIVALTETARLMAEIDLVGVE